MVLKQKQKTNLIEKNRPSKSSIFGIHLFTFFLSFSLGVIKQQKTCPNLLLPKLLQLGHSGIKEFCFLDEKERKCNEQRFFRHRSQIYFSEGLFLSLLIKTEEKKQIKMLRAFCQTRAPVVGMGRA